MAQAMDDKNKLAFLKQQYKKLSRESAAREQEMKDLQAETDAKHERERCTFELQTEELRDELQTSKALWRTLKDENEKMKQEGITVAPQGADSEGKKDVSAVDRMANVFKNIGRVDFEKECKELRVKLQAYEDETVTKAAEHTQLLATLDTQEEECLKARVALEELRQNASGHDAVLSARTKALEAHSEQIRGEVILKQSELEASQEHLRASKQREERLREDYKQEQLKNTALRQEKQETGPRLAAAEERREQVKQLEQRCIDLESQLLQASTQRKEAEVAIEALQAVHSTAPAELCRLSSIDSSASEAGSTDSLHVLLEDAKHLKEFREFVRQHDPDGERYLIFWQDLKDHNELASMVDDAEALHQTAGIICEKYLSASAESKIILDSKIVTQIERDLTQAKLFLGREPQSDLTHVFDEAKTQVLAFVQTQLYPAFLQAGSSGVKPSKGRRRRQK